MAMSKAQKRNYAKTKDEESRAKWFANLATGIEGDSLPWRKPWKPQAGGTSCMPINFASKRAYRGGNIVSLWVRAMCEGWDDLRFGTRNQLKNAGYSIKGLTNDVGATIKLFKPTVWEKKKEDGETEKRQGMVLRWYTVFCVEQCEDYVAPVPDETDDDVEVMPESEMMELFQQYVDSQSSLTFKRAGGQAYYRSSDDQIVLPPHESFTDPVGEVMTAMHEASHSTGYSTRLNRPLGNGFGSQAYAYEELIAELSSLIVTLTLGGEFKPGIVAEENANSVAYLQSWLKACKEQDKALDKAFSDAQKSADFILATLEGDEQ